MYKENLFELIRREEVVIWAGAGMSVYAGYPTGKELSEILIKNLTEKEKDLINCQLPLPGIAEEYYRLKGNNRNSLIKILRDIFLKEPKSKFTHESISTIPHIKTIITTNYDRLFEDVYQEKAHVIYDKAQIPYIDQRQIQIFKIHGDLSNPDSIIITNSDYNNFFKNNTDSGTFWAVIRERLATKNVLFLGYNIEDPNVSVVFERITESLGDNRRECFLISPKLPQHKVSDLTRKGIHYIDSTAEDFISELISHLKEHIIADIESGKISADTFRQFLANVNLLPSLKAEKDRYLVSALKGLNENVQVTGKMIFDYDEGFIKNLNDFIIGRNLGGFKIPDDKLVSIDMWYGGIKYPHFESIQGFEFRRIPIIDTKIDIRFEDSFEYNDIPVKVYASKLSFEVQLGIENADIVLKGNWEDASAVDGNLTYQHKGLCKNVKSEIEFFTLLNNIAQGKAFTVYHNFEKVTSIEFQKSSDILEQTVFFLDYFNCLKMIESHFKIRFSNIKTADINNTTIRIVEHLAYVIKNGYWMEDCFEEFTLRLVDNYSEDMIRLLKELNNENGPVVAINNVNEIIELHGHQINLGKKRIECQESYVLNLDEIVERKVNIVRLKSRNNKFHFSYIN